MVNLAQCHAFLIPKDEGGRLSVHDGTTHTSWDSYLFLYQVVIRFNQWLTESGGCVGIWGRERMSSSHRACMHGSHRAHVQGQGQ